MAGKIKVMLDSIVAQRSKGNNTIAQTTKAKLIFKGFDPDRYTAVSADDPETIARVKAIASELGINLN